MVCNKLKFLFVNIYKVFWYNTILPSPAVTVRSCPLCKLVSGSQSSLMRGSHYTMLLFKKMSDQVIRVGDKWQTTRWSPVKS